MKIPMVGAVATAVGVLLAVYFAASEWQIAQNKMAKWKVGPALPRARGGLRTVHIPAHDGNGRGDMMVAGGHGTKVSGQVIASDSVNMFNVDLATWSDSTAMPVATHNFGMAHIPALDGGGRGDVMVAGGFDGGKLRDSVLMYNVDAATWSESTAMPFKTHMFAMVHIPAHDGIGRGTVMAAGGYGGKRADVKSANVLNSVYLFSVDAATWSESTAMPVGLYYFGMVYLPADGGAGGGHVMAVGGNGGLGAVEAVFIYSVDSEVWAESTALPARNHGFGIVYIPAHDGVGRGQVMVAAGSGYAEEGPLDAVYIYSVDAATWSTITELPVACHGFGMTYIPAHDGAVWGQVIVSGGLGLDNAPLDSVYIYSVDSAMLSESTPVRSHDTFLSLVYTPAQTRAGKGHVAAVNRLGGYDGMVSEAIYTYSVDGATWMESTSPAKPKTDNVGIAYIPARDGVGGGQVMFSRWDEINAGNSAYTFEPDAGRWSESIVKPVNNNKPAANH